MKATIHAKNITVSPYLEELIGKKLNKLDRFFPNDAEAQVKLSIEKNRQICEISIPYGHMTVRAKDSSGDIYSSVDASVEKLEKQIVHYRTKYEKQKRHAMPLGAMEVELPEETDERAVVRTKTFDLKPMEVEEAILQMSTLDHSFYVFLNAENNQVNVLYLRDDGELGLIHSEAGSI